MMPVSDTVPTNPSDPDRGPGMMIYSGTIPRTCEDPATGRAVGFLPAIPRSLTFHGCMYHSAAVDYFRVVDRSGRVFCQGKIGDTADCDIRIKSALLELYQELTVTIQNPFGLAADSPHYERLRNRLIESLFA
jgi:hypothetical protein